MGTDRDGQDQVEPELAVQAVQWRWVPPNDGPQEVPGVKNVAKYSTPFFISVYYTANSTSITIQVPLPGQLGLGSRTTYNYLPRHVNNRSCPVGTQKSIGYQSIVKQALLHHVTWFWYHFDSAVHQNILQTISNQYKNNITFFAYQICITWVIQIWYDLVTLLGHMTKHVKTSFLC